MHQSLIPDFLSDSLAASGHSIDTLELPYRASCHAGIFFTDICSFTSVTQKLSSRGHYGVEDIIEILNDYFSAMLTCVEEEGGSLVKFGGDAMFMVFPGEPELVIPRIIHCKERMQEAMDRLNVDFGRKYKVEIAYNGAIKYGQIHLNVVGDPCYHLDYYVDGMAVRDLYSLAESAKRGEIIVSEEIKDYLELPYQPPIHREPLHMNFAESFVSENVKEKLKEQSFGAELRNSAAIFIHLCPPEGMHLIPEDMFHRCYKVIQKQVYELDGTINKIDFTDKGYLILITFGTPYGHTDDIERAFTCSFRLKHRCDTGLMLRQGITYSNIFAGILGSKRRHEYGVIGNMVNVAARLMQASKENEISFSEELLEHVHTRFDSRFVEETQVKGISSPIRIHRLLDELPDSWFSIEEKYQSRSLVAHESFVGGVLADIRAGHSCLVQLTGEPGSGKSFLAYQILKGCQGDHAAGIHIDALDEYNARVQCDWFLRLIARYLMIFDIKKELGRLIDYCRKIDLPADEKLIGRYFGVSGAKAGLLDNDMRRSLHFMLSRIALSLLKDSSMIFIDDIEWMDLGSCEIFGMLLADLLERKASCVILAAKKIPDDYLLPSSDGAVHSLQLGPLGFPEAQSLIRHELPLISLEAARLLFDLSKGNPLFLVELARVVRGQSDKQTEILAEADMKRFQNEGIITDTIENLLLSEYESLLPEAKRTLKIASIIGKAFALEDLNQVSDAKQRDKIDGIVWDLSQEKIIGKHNFDPGIRYIFQNQLMRDAIYRTILLSEKRSLHEKLAQLYEKKLQEKDDGSLEKIAYHYIMAQSPVKAHAYALKAAQKTARMAAYAVSNYYYEQALEFCSESRECYEIRLAILRNWVLQGDPAKAKKLADSIREQHGEMLDAQFHLQWMRILLLAGDYRDLITYFEDSQEEIMASDQAGAIILRYMDALQFLNLLKEYGESEEILLKLMRANPDPKLEGDYLISRALLYLNRSDYSKAEEGYRRLLKISRKQENVTQERIALNGLGIVASRTGKKDEAQEYYQKALGICERLGDRTGYSKLLMETGTLYRNQGDIKEAIRLYQISLESARSIGNKNLCGTIEYNLGEAHYYLEEDEKAEGYFESALKIYEECGDLVGRSFCYDAIGDLNFTRGNLEEAQRLYEMNLVLQKELKDTEGIAHTLGNLGNIAKAKEDYPTAESYYQAQLPLLSKVGDIDGLGRCHFNHAMILKDQGLYQDAKEKLALALELFEKCKAQIFIDIAKEQMQDILTELSKGDL